jgi:hypothetical protein
MNLVQRRAWVHASTAANTARTAAAAAAPSLWPVVNGCYVHGKDSAGLLAQHVSPRTAAESTTAMHCTAAAANVRCVLQQRMCICSSACASAYSSTCPSLSSQPRHILHRHRCDCFVFCSSMCVSCAGLVHTTDSKSRSCVIHS